MANLPPIRILSVSDIHDCAGFRQWVSDQQEFDIIFLPGDLIDMFGMLPGGQSICADAFFASCEQAADPRLRGKPVAVGGEKRGIVASASYEARKYGVYTPMPTAHARRICPKLIVIPGDFERYEHFSKMMFSYATTSRQRWRSVASTKASDCR